MENLVPALVARRYYLEGRNKSEIGQELGISRFKVARILEEAMRTGLVRVQIDIPAEIDLDLSEQLAARYRLRQVLVVNGPEDPAGMRRQLGKTCAALLRERLSGEDVLGVSWGRTLHALADVITELPPVEVVQMVGSVPTVDLAINSLELVRRLGEAAGGGVHAIHVPMILDSAELAGSLRKVRHVAETLEACNRVTCALVGIGAWKPGESLVREALPAPLARELESRSAVADICSTVVDTAGRVVGADVLQDRCISATTEQLRRIPDVIALAGGAARAHAIAAVIRAGLVHRLITDAGAARALLDLDDAEAARRVGRP